MVRVADTDRLVNTSALDTANPREQAIANSFVKGFDRDRFQRLIVQWIVNTNRPFTDAEDRDLRAIFEYINVYLLGTYKTF
jgi:hypothetical protein